MLLLKQLFFITLIHKCLGHTLMSRNRHVNSKGRKKFHHKLLKGHCNSFYLNLKILRRNKKKEERGGHNLTCPVQKFLDPNITTKVHRDSEESFRKICQRMLVALSISHLSPDLRQIYSRGITITMESHQQPPQLPSPATTAVGGGGIGAISRGVDDQGWVGFYIGCGWFMKAMKKVEMT